MFGKKKITETPKVVSKEDELGPRPADVPNTEPLIKFQVLLRHSLPSIEVMAHAHDFGQPADCDKPRLGNYTHFVVRGTQGWQEHRRHVRTVHGNSLASSYEIYKWEWVPKVPVNVVFSIRTDDVVMVVAMDNAQAASSESLALERREDPVGQRPDPTGGWVGGPATQGGRLSGVYIDVD